MWKEGGCWYVEGRWLLVCGRKVVVSMRKEG